MRHSEVINLVSILLAFFSERGVIISYRIVSSCQVLEKEFLLQDIVKDAVLGSANAEGRRVGPVCSKRIYRLLMAQNGNLRTEAAEDGEDYFSQQRE